MVSEQIINRITKQIKEWLELNIEYSKNHDETILKNKWSLEKDIIEDFFRIDNIKEKYAYKDILDRISNISFRFEKGYDKISEEEITKYVTEILEARSKENILGLLELPQLEEFPDVLKIGSSKIYSFEKLPGNFKKSIREELEYDYNRKKEKGELENQSKDDFFKKNISNYWAVRKISAVGFYQLYQNTQLLINNDLNILRLTYNFRREQIPIYQKKIYLYDTEKNQMYKSEVYTNKIHYLSFLDKDIKVFSEIVNKDKKTDIENRIEITLVLAGIAIESSVLHVRFLMIMAAIEGLVLNKDDILYGLTKRLSIKIPLIIEDDPKKRLQLSKLMKHYYRLRSDIAHATKKSISIEEGDIRNLFNIYLRTIFKLLELQKNEGIEQVQSNKNKPSLDKYIEEQCLG